MENPTKPSQFLDRYYFYDDARRIVYYSEEYLTESHLIYLGTSNNPNPTMAAAVFIQNEQRLTGFQIWNYDDR